MVAGVLLFPIGLWLLTQVTNILGRSVLPLLLIVGGSWIMWLSVIWWWRKRIQPKLDRVSPDGGMWGSR